MFSHLATSCYLPSGMRLTLRAQSLALSRGGLGVEDAAVECRVQVVCAGRPLTDELGADGTGWVQVNESTRSFNFGYPRGGAQFAFGDADAPQKFVAPGDWPKRVRGYPLGKRVADVRSRGRYVGGDDPSSEQLARRRRLDELGFRWTKRKGRRRVAK